MSSERLILTYVTTVTYLILSFLACVGFAGWFKVFISRKLGDDTASRMGMETIDPFVHADILGFMALLIFGVGWGKQIPFDFDAFQGKWARLRMVVAYYADVCMHLLLATCSIFVLGLVNYSLNRCGLLDSSYGTVWQTFIQNFFGLNVFIASIRIITHSFTLGVRWWLGSDEFSDNPMFALLMLIGPLLLLYVYGSYIQYACHLLVMVMCRLLFWFLG